MLEEPGVGERIGVVGSGRGFYVLSVFILNIGLARAMGAEGFGAFQQVFMFSAFFMLMTLGIPETLYFFLPRLTAEERPVFLGQTILFMTGSGILLSLVLWFGASFFSGIQDNPGIAPNLRVFGIYGAFYVASSFADPIFIIFRRVKFLFLLSFLHGLFFIVLTGWEYFTGIAAGQLFIAMAGFAAFKFALALMLVYGIRPIIGEIVLSGSKKMAFLQASFALPVALSNSIEIISTWLDKFVISIYLGKETLGVFYVGALEIPFVAVLLSSVYSVVSPLLNSLHHRGDLSGFADLVRKTIAFTAKWIWPLWIYLFVFADRLIPLVFGYGYIASVVPFRIYLLLMPLRVALYGAIVLALGKPRIVFWTALGALLLNFILNIILVTHLGMAGPAIATILSSYIHVAVLLWLIMRFTGARLGALVPFRGLIEIGLTAGCAVAAGFLITSAGIFETDLQVVAFSAPVFITIYLYAGKRAGFIRLLALRDILEGGSRGRKAGNNQD
jgi:O-antigen/teichoic acid export membrane protein